MCSQIVSTVLSVRHRIRYNGLHSYLHAIPLMGNGQYGCLYMAYNTNKQHSCFCAVEHIVQW